MAHTSYVLLKLASRSLVLSALPAGISPTRVEYRIREIINTLIYVELLLFKI